MKKLELQVSFVTPAFLGNAEQQGQWRTPPFKTLLRQWWRVVVAEDCRNYDVTTLRKREADLFGSAAGEDKGGQSKVRIRLGQWKNGTKKNWNPLEKVCHPEVDLSHIGNPHAKEKAYCKSHDKHHKISADVYLGFGPVGLRGLDKAPCVDPGDSNTLHVMGDDQVMQAAQLAAWFGTLGSRSRNGWGSLLIQGDGVVDVGALLDDKTEALREVSRPLDECMKLDWPHAFGSDGRLLIWISKPFNDWQPAMKHLAETKIAFRTALPVNSGFQDRHLLAYPVTHHTVNGWGNQARLANQLRFKVVKHNGYHYALVFHLPCALPQELAKKLGHSAPSEQQQCQAWQQVHRVLDDDNQMSRIGGAA